MKYLLADRRRPLNETDSVVEDSFIAVSVVEVVVVDVVDVEVVDGGTRRDTVFLARRTVESHI